MPYTITNAVVMTLTFGISLLFIIALIIESGWNEFKLKISSKLIELELSANNGDSND